MFALAERSSRNSQILSVMLDEGEARRTSVDFFLVYDRFSMLEIHSGSSRWKTVKTVVIKYENK